MAYIVEPTEQEDAALGNLAPSFGESLRTSVRSTFSENASTLIFDSGELRQANAYGKPRLTVDEASARAQRAGVKLSIPPDSYTEEAVDLLIKRQKDRAAVELMQERTPWGWLGTPIRGGASLLTGVVDPLNVASAFIPVVREQRAAAMLARAGGSVLGRAGVRAGIGAVEGTVGAAVLEPLVAGLHDQLQDDYGMADSLVNLAFGTVLGGGLHASVGAVADFTAPKVRQGSVVEATLPPVVPRESVAGSAADTLRAADPATRELAMRAAIADMAEGKAPNVEAMLPQRQTDTPEFRAWFGESKVVDETGAPMVVYHGTTADIAEMKSRADLTGQADWMAGMYFARDPDYANQYTYQTGPGSVDYTGGNVMPVYVSMKNPKILEGDSLASAAVSRADVAEFKAQGFDGIINKSGDEYVVFDSTQVKSAIGNSGRFDPNSPSLTDPAAVSRERLQQPSAAADSGAAGAADTRLAAAPKDNAVEAAQVELDAATKRLDDISKSLQAGGMTPEQAGKLIDGLKPFDDAIAEAKKTGDAIRNWATCGTLT